MPVSNEIELNVLERSMKRCSEGLVTSLAVRGGSCEEPVKKYQYPPPRATRTAMIMRGDFVI
jgi:hypothetical protein